MIIKSLSRKTPSFAQLIEYMNSEKSDSHYDLYHNCFSRNQEDLTQEFIDNSKLLSKRKGSNYLYHEIISITTNEGKDRTYQKESLYQIVHRYVQDRCPRNMVYGCLHEDHAHNLHYHLLFSANERGEQTRLRLTQKQFDTVKRDLEKHVLQEYPELQQEVLINSSASGEKMTRRAGEVQRRLKKLPQKEQVTETLRTAMQETASIHEFCRFLDEKGYQFYTRGKNYGVEVTHANGKTRKYRFSTLGVHDDFEEFEKLHETSSQDNSDDASVHEKAETTSQETPTNPPHERTQEETEEEYISLSKKKYSQESKNKEDKH